MKALSIILLLLLQSKKAEALHVGSRRDILVQQGNLCLPFLVVAGRALAAADNDGFAYSADWTGTALPVLSLETSSSRSTWDMGRWPDPILRRPAQPVDARWFGTSTLSRAAHLLERTATQNKAVGLAAQQCGVDARIVYLKSPRKLFLINPSIVQRSPEIDMRVWKEYCLVLPPHFRATVLRDAWIIVEYHDLNGTLHSIRLSGEAARAAQHELDHDRGILTLDHVGLDELENDTMRTIEREGHNRRQAMAFARDVNEREQ